MDFDRIEKLLQKYWECETSLEEEKELKHFFNSEEVPEKWQTLKPLFKYFEKEKAEGSLDHFFDQRVLAQIEEIERTDNKAVAPEGKVRKLFADILKIAAVVLVLVTSVYFVRQNIIENDKPVIANVPGAIEDPKEAFEEAKKALLMISKNFNKGKKEVSKMSVFHEAQEQVKNQSETL